MTQDDREPTGTTMHDGVETWDDICLCEPEARWKAVAEELERRDREHASS